MLLEVRIGDLARPDPARRIPRTARAARELEPPVPVDVEDVEHLVARERGAVPVDVPREVEEEPLAPFVSAVLLEQAAAVVIRVGVVELRLSEDVRQPPVAEEQSPQFLAVAIGVELAAQEDGDHLVLRYPLEQPHCPRRSCSSRARVSSSS